MRGPALVFSLDISSQHDCSCEITSVLRVTPGSQAAFVPEQAQAASQAKRAQPCCPQALTTRGVRRARIGAQRMTKSQPFSRVRRAQSMRSAPLLVGVAASAAPGRPRRRPTRPARRTIPGAQLADMRRRRPCEAWAFQRISCSKPLSAGAGAKACPARSAMPAPLLTANTSCAPGRASSRDFIRPSGAPRLPRKAFVRLVTRATFSIRPMSRPARLCPPLAWM